MGTLPQVTSVSFFSSSVTGQTERVSSPGSPFDDLHVGIQVPLLRRTSAISGYLRQKVSDGEKDPTPVGSPSKGSHAAFRRGKEKGWGTSVR